jgi:hypothetical protein
VTIALLVAKQTWKGVSERKATSFNKAAGGYEKKK